MAPAATLYNLFWCGELPGDQPTMEQVVRPAAPLPIPVALNVDVRWRKPPPIEAIILWPAFLTPGICVAAEGAFFELLLLAPKPGGDVPAFNAYLVNTRLKVSPGLEAGRESWRYASADPLFPDPKGHIEVSKPLALDRDAPLESHSAFRGLVDARFWDNLDAWKKERGQRAATKDRPPFEVLYQVKVHASCLAGRVGPTAAKVRELESSSRAGPPSFFRAMDAGDELVRSVLRRMNGKGLGGLEGPGDPAGDGRGLHAFPVRDNVQVEVLDLAGIDRDQPVRAFHPLYLYPPDAAAHFALGHASDLHVNSRQQFLARSPARVIDPAPGFQGGEGQGTLPIGDLVNVYGDNFFQVLLELDNAGADAFLIGGDLVDHVKNVFPFTEHYPAYRKEPGKLSAPTVKQVWELMELKDSDRKEKNYQRFVDHLSFYSLVRHFCQARRKPMFVVTGNHDGYLEPFGVSPRVLGNKANEGIPADHNLTFYEAILAFGPSYAEVQPTAAIWLHKVLFGWFHGVFTPFRDYAVDLPRQRVVGLAWGDDETKFDTPATNHGFGHLPRANKAAEKKPWELLKKAADGDKKVVLFTHFTFVSYGEATPNVVPQAMPDAPQRGKVRTSELTLADALPLVGVAKHFSTYTEYDFGTFEDHRPELYDLVHSGKLQAVFTGHSHRKGLYVLTEKASGVERAGHSTAMYGLRYPQTMEGRALREIRGRHRTPIVVSDSAGPLPRMNWADELYNWGSDRPAGTLLKLDPQGDPVEVVAVPALTARAKPRLGVALNYLHVMDGKKRGIARIASDPIAAFEADFSYGRRPHGLVLTFAEEFPQAVLLAGVTLHALPRKGGKWLRIQLGMPAPVPDKERTVQAPVPQAAARDFRLWLSTQGVPRFLSLTFSPRNPNGIVAKNYEAGARGTWHMAVTHTVEGSISSSVQAVIEPLSEIPDFAMLKTYFPDIYG